MTKIIELVDLESLEPVNVSWILMYGLKDLFGIEIAEPEEENDNKSPFLFTQAA